MKVIVIGGGPAGMSAAIFAAQNAEVLLIEKNEKLGKKLYITGKGRCNVTNDTFEEDFFNNVVTNPRFLMSAINSFTPADVMEFFTENGLRLKTERGNRVFPASDKSSDVIKTLARVLDNSGVEVELDCRAESLIVKDGVCIGVKTENGDVYGDAVIVATGGISYPLTGSTGDGYIFARSVGLDVIKPVAALSAFIVKGGFAALAGLTLKNVNLKVFYSGKLVSEEFGEMLFTHEGISGPIVLTTSSRINRLEADKLKVTIDLKPALDEKSLNDRVLRDFEKYSNKQLKNALFDLLPSALIPFVIGRSGIDEEKKVNVISKDERKKLVSALKFFEIPFAALAPIKEAIVTSGGINVKEINPKTMESKKVKNLYFAGEVLDVDAYTGGFNLQIAFSTGVAAGRGAATEKNNVL